MLNHTSISFLVLDLHSFTDGIPTIESVRRARPGLRVIVLGPEGNDELVMESIIAGARGYLELTAGPEMVRRAIDVVTGGSIWAPRRLLSN